MFVVEFFFPMVALFFEFMNIELVVFILFVKMMVLLFPIVTFFFDLVDGFLVFF
jgi:hypothetical protein